MALIRQSNAGTLLHEAVVLDLGDLRRQGELMQAQARSQAAAIVAQAQAERARLIATAADEGRAKGFQQGVEEGKQVGAAEGKAAALVEQNQKLAALQAAWTAGLERFEQERDRMLLEARQDVLRLALLAAEKITKRAIAADPDVVEAQMAAVLATLARPTRLTIAVHPDDQPRAAEALPGLIARIASSSQASLVADPSLEPGSCVARTDGGARIDASIATQLDRVIEALLPGHRREGASPPTIPPPLPAPEAQSQAGPAGAGDAG